MASLDSSGEFQILISVRGSHCQKMIMLIKTIKERENSGRSRKTVQIFQIMVTTMTIIFRGEDGGFSPWLLMSLAAP